MIATTRRHRPTHFVNRASFLHEFDTVHISRT